MWDITGDLIMKKNVKKILVIVGFSLLGCLVGYFVVKTQESQLQNPQYLKVWVRNNMPIPEPLSYLSAMTGFAMLFGGIPTGIIIFMYIVNRVVAKEKVKTGWIFLAGILLFPMYTVIGAVVILPVLVFQIVICVTKRDVP